MLSPYNALCQNIDTCVENAHHEYRFFVFSEVSLALRLCALNSRLWFWRCGIVHILHVLLRSCKMALLTLLQRSYTQAWLRWHWRSCKTDWINLTFYLSFNKSYFILEKISSLNRRNFKTVLKGFQFAIKSGFIPSCKLIELPQKSDYHSFIIDLLNHSFIFFIFDF